MQHNTTTFIYLAPACRYDTDIVEFVSIEHSAFAASACACILVAICLGIRPSPSSTLPPACPQAHAFYPLPCQPLPTAAPRNTLIRAVKLKKEGRTVEELAARRQLASVTLESALLRLHLWWMYVQRRSQTPFACPWLACLLSVPCSPGNSIPTYPCEQGVVPHVFSLPTLERWSWSPHTGQHACPHSSPPHSCTSALHPSGSGICGA